MLSSQSILTKLDEDDVIRYIRQYCSYFIENPKEKDSLVNKSIYQ